MDDTTLDPLKYPIGKFVPPASYTEQQIRQWIDEIKSLPGKLRLAVMSLSETQLDTPYRPGGWKIRQVVHHVPDSHANAYIRFKLALTEDNPTIKAYEEGLWALLPDYKMSIEPSLKMLEAIHLRWVTVLESLDSDQWRRTYTQPVTRATAPLQQVLGMYAWHGNHHLAHIAGVKF